MSITLNDAQKSDVKRRKYSKEQRISCRVSQVVKDNIELAAEALGLSITEFVERSLSEASQKTLQEQEQFRMSERDFRRFIEVTENPPAPTPYLLEAVKKYNKLRAENPESNL